MPRDYLEDKVYAKLSEKFKNAVDMGMVRGITEQLRQEAIKEQHELEVEFDNDNTDNT